MGLVTGAALLGPRFPRFKVADAVFSETFLVVGIVALQALEVCFRLGDRNGAVLSLLETPFDVVVTNQTLLRVEEVGEIPIDLAGIRMEGLLQDVVVAVQTGHLPVGRNMKPSWLHKPTGMGGSHGAHPYTQAQNPQYQQDTGSHGLFRFVRFHVPYSTSRLWRWGYPNHIRSVGNCHRPVVGLDKMIHGFTQVPHLGNTHGG
jgi:hypothetical protein